MSEPTTMNENQQISQILIRVNLRRIFKGEDDE